MVAVQTQRSNPEVKSGWSKSSRFSANKNSVWCDRLRKEREGTLCVYAQSRKGRAFKYEEITTSETGSSSVFFPLSSNNEQILEKQNAAAKPAALPYACRPTKESVRESEVFLRYYIFRRWRAILLRLPEGSVGMTSLIRTFFMNGLVM